MSNAAPGAARRRYLTMLFSDLCESTRLAASMEAEQYAEVLGHLRRAYQDVIPRHGGTIVQIQGDGLLAIFGHPVEREDDGRRAAEAALDLHEAVQRVRLDPSLAGPSGLALHTGIHAGLVLFDEGDLVRGRFEMLGNATNIASHLADVAQENEILVSEETLGPERYLFRTGEHRQLELKGHARPIAVVQVLGRAPVNTRFEASARRGLTPFIGRERELQALERALLEARAGRARRVVISAAAGLGKTRLAEEFLRRAEALGFRIQRGYCESDLSAEPLQPFLQMLRALFHLDRGIGPVQAAEAVERALERIEPALLARREELLGALSLARQETRPGGERSVAAQHTVAAMRELFGHLCARQPLVVFVDDWHWADDASHEVLDAIGGLEASPLLLLIATREPAAADEASGDAPVLELAPLSEAETAQAIGRLLPRSDPVAVARIQAHAGGNPLYIEELCHSAAYEDTARRLSRPQASSAWLDQLIGSRLARLPEAQAVLVRAAAVIGNVFAAWLLERLTGCGETHPLVLALAAQDFVFPGEQPGTLRFKHGLTREAIYGTVGLHQRKALHLRIAESLLEQGAPSGQEEHYEALAYHFDAAGDAAQAARFAELAGDKAVGASALDRAQKQYRAALSALERLAPSEENYRRWSAIAQRYGLACVFDPSRHQLAILRHWIGRARAHRDPAGLARAEYWLGYVSYALGEPRVAIAHLERALAAADGGEASLLAQIRATLGQARAAAGDYERALALLDEAIAARRSRGPSARPAVGYAYTLACKAAVLGDRGSFADAQACFDEALEAVRGANHEVEASVLGWRSHVYLWQGRWESARQSAADAQRVAERVKSRFMIAADRAVGGFASWSLGPTPRALQTIVDATAWRERHERRMNISLNYGWLAHVMAATGRFAEVRGPAAQTLARARRYDRLGLAMTYRALAHASAHGHGRKPPEHYLRLAFEAARARQSRHEIAVTQLCEAEIAAARGDRRAAIASIDQAEPAFESMQMAWHLEQARRLRASL